MGRPGILDELGDSNSMSGDDFGVPEEEQADSLESEAGDASDQAVNDYEMRRAGKPRMPRIPKPKLPKRRGRGRR